MKRFALAAAVLFAACDPTYVTSPAPVPMENPCLYRTYHDPACDSGYNWSPGYYNPSHVWIAPRYVRRTVIVTPPPVVVTRPTYVVPRTTVVVPPPSRPYYRTPVTTTTTVRQSSPSRPRPTTTVTTTRRYR